MDAARSDALPIHDYLNDEAEPYTVSTVKTTEVQKYLIEQHGADLLTERAEPDAAPESRPSNVSRSVANQSRAVLCLPAGTEYVQFGELAHEIAAALFPLSDGATENEEMAYAGARINLDAELLEAVKDGTLPVKDPLTLGPHTFPVGDTLRRSLVMVDDLRAFLAGRPITVGIAPEPTAAPVVAASESRATAGPLPLPTGDIAFSFAGLRWKTEAEWKKPLGDKPKWLQACIVTPGRRGVSEALWNPVCIGAALVREGHVRVNSMRAAFQTKPPLIPWLDEWKTYEAEYLDNG